MAKVYNQKTHAIEWEDDILCAVEDAYWEVEEVVEANKRTENHDELIWLVEVKTRLKDLMDTLAKHEYLLDDIVNRHIIF